MSVSVQVTTDRAKWKRTIDQANSIALGALGEQMMNDSLQYIPKREGPLRSSGRVTIKVGGRGYLVWSTPYARRQWFGVGIHRYTTPGTGPMWVEKARMTRSAAWAQVAQNAFNRGMP